MSKPKHGAVWGTWLVLLMLHGLGAIWLAYVSQNPEYADNRSLIVTSLVIAAFLQVIGVIGMWFWKTWGFISLYGCHYLFKWLRTWS